MKPLAALLCFCACAGFAAGREVNLVQNPGFEEADASSRPVAYEMKGAALWGPLGRAIDFATHGIIFPGDAPSGGSIAQMIRLDPAKGRWVDFRFRGLAEDGFSVTDNSLKMKIEFYSKNGTDYLDCASLPFYDQVERDRKNLTVNGDYHQGGAAVWRSYELEELLPFKEVDAVKIIVSYDAGQATTPEHAAFLVDDFSLVQHDRSVTGRVDPADRIAAMKTAAVDTSRLVSLGGRWYYEPAPGEVVGNSTPLVVTEENADRLFYKSDRLINPFLNNMTAWLRAGYKDEQGDIVTEDQFVPDNVVLTFKGDGFLTLTSKNLPNHPTAKFPGFNPSYIQEMTRTYKLPLEPVLDPDAKAMTANDSNRALPMGPIGVAVNGVVFFNPFDAGMNDASNIMDYCCGHPNPGNQYHYHKYPICVNTPFIDKGDAPSQVIGFAFDGLPIYGPYQDVGVMAKDSTTNPLNDFNACYDDVRGWHYHVTPGKFPYVIGGYFAKVEASNIQHLHPRGEATGRHRFPGPGVASGRRHGRHRTTRTRRFRAFVRPSSFLYSPMADSGPSNVLGEPLQPCCFFPVTGFYRDGFCRTGPGDRGLHTVCIEVTADFLAFSRTRGNDLSTPRPEYEFPGLVPGDRWCLCVTRWKEALDAGMAPRVVLASTHVSALEFVSREDLQEHAVAEEQGS